MYISFDAIYAVLERKGCYSDYAQEYGEPGYKAEPNGIIFANWNRAPKHVYEWLEHHGFSLEWSDEWIQDSNTGKAYRTSSDCWGWMPSYLLTDRSAVIGKDEVLDGSEIDAYLEHLLNDANHCDTFGIDWAKYGFTKLEPQLENGWFPGQNDTPEKALKAGQAAHPDCDFLFTLDENSQFYSKFSLWFRPEDYDAA